MAKACLLAGAGLLIVGGVLADWGSETAFGLGLTVVIERWLVGGTLAGAYLLAAFGYGAVIAKRLTGGAGWAPLAMAIGLGAMLTLSHALGVLGLLGANAVGRVVAIGTIALGVGLTLRAWRGEGLRRGLGWGWDAGGRLGRGWLVGLAALPAAGVLWVASAVPPGWLWGSEFGGYDTLSYHLQLPQEWLEHGRLWPMAHNVYSFLPGYAEAGWLHLASASLAPGEPGGLSAPRGLLTGAPIYGAQMLSAMVTIVAAWLVGATAAALDRRVRGAGEAAGESESRARVAGWFAGLLVLATPWSVVTGSMAYHEMYVVALGAGAMLAALMPGVNPTRRWLLAAALVGGACGAKPTAILMLTPPVAMALLWTGAHETQGLRLGERVRGLARPLAVGVVAGMVMLSPWLVRNAAASGNPVFPFASSVFGPGHWSPAQHERYAAAHRAEGSLADRVRLAAWAEPVREGASASALRQRHRGVLHPQWGVLFPVAGLAIVALLAARTTRGAGVVLGVGLLAQLAAWLTLTHVQSRFLLPSLVLLAPAVGLALGAIAARGRAPWVMALGGGLVLAQSATTAFLFVTEREGRAVLPLLSGVEGYTGDLARETMGLLDEAGRNELMRDQSPVALANLLLPPGSRLMLLGDATPLYLRVAHDYRTVWDAWAVGDEAGVPPHRWSNALIDAGATHALVNLAELSRFERSGYAPAGVDAASASLWLTIVEEQGQGRVLRAWPRGSVLIELHRERILRPERRP